MPSSVSGQNNYYASHHRRPSQQSHGSLSDQVEAQNVQIQSPSRSLVYLPATTYSQPAPGRTRKLSESGNISNPSSSTNPIATGDFDPVSTDPHEFYRQGFVAEFQEQAPAIKNGLSLTSSRGQTGRRTSSNSQFSPPTLYEASKSTPALTGALRSRKASFKDLVAKFDSSNGDEIPPVPSRPGSRVASRTVSPTVTGRAPSLDTHGLRARKDRSFGSETEGFYTKSGSNANAINTSLNISIPPKRPLFGEIVPGTSAPSKAGYGIQNARRRRGSEGSPMHSPNPMFPTESAASNSGFSPISPTAWYTGKPSDSLSVNTRQATSIAKPSPHRRAQSDFSGAGSDGLATQDPVLNRIRPTAQTRDSGDLSQLDTRRTSQSRIPVSNRRYSLTSDSGRSSPSSRAASMIGKYTNSRAGAATTNSSLPKSSSKHSSPKRNKQSLTPIKSPGKRGHGNTIPQSQKSPSLRANIIAPPPKISPPLRSSRPRVPISSASTLASRAKLAEKFTTMQKQNSEKIQSNRRPQRPPELNDVDLRARRLRITQALTRSRQGLDLQESELASRRTSSNVNASDSETLKQISPVTEIGPPSATPSLVPSVVLDRSAVEEDGEQETFHTPVDDFDQSSRMPGHYKSMATVSEIQPGLIDVDSPTLGQSEKAAKRQPSLLQAHLQTLEQDYEPCSGATTDTGDTEATPIDAEPQSEFVRPAGRTVLSQIMRMRSPSPASQHSFDSSHTDDHAEDHADDESVQIVLRNTRYLDEDTGFQEAGVNKEEYEGSDDRSDPNYQGRNSWTSSIQEPSSDDGVLESAPDSREQPEDDRYKSEGPSNLGHQSQMTLESIRSTMASDAYTIVNFVLRQHSTSGIVDDEVADYIYQRVINQPPRLTDQGTLDSQNFEQLCINELQDFEHQRQSTIEDSAWNQDAHTRASNATIRTLGPQPGDSGAYETFSDVAVDDETHVVPKRPSYMTHRHKASLDSAEDFAETSPSIGSWMQFATDHVHPHSNLNQSVEAEQDDTLRAQRFYQDNDEHGSRDHAEVSNMPPRQASPSLEVVSTILRPPSKSPPPPPMSRQASFYSQAITHGSSGPTLTHIVTSATFPPTVPRRVTSLSRMTTQSSFDRNASMQSLAEADQVSNGRPSLETPSLQSSSLRSSPTPEQRKLKQRRHVLKELVDTEARFEKDMKVLCDIYKETAFPTLSHDDIKVLFGNSEQVLEFVVDFLSLLKQAAKPAYLIDRSERYQNVKSHEDHARSQSADAISYSTARDSASIQPSDTTDVEKDQMTRVGEAFELSLPNMGAVYAEYLKNHDAANKKLQDVQRHSLVREWLSECKKGSADLTNAWDLDSLMVKPVQRILKYPLLLGQLIEATPADHPDLQSLKGALTRLTEINMRINEAKKHTELVDQVFKRKRKESDVRNGISKALGRRTEKLRQHVGISEMFEDREYNSLKHEYIENYGHLVVVSNDVQKYKGFITSWVDQMCDLGAAADAWVDVGHTRHTEAESKLRQFGMLVRAIRTIALPDHVGEVQKRVIDPLEKAWKCLESLADDPKGLLQKRDKRLIDYARFKNLKDRGEKLDKKTIERIEQWEALNTEAKDRMKKLLALTTKLVGAAQSTYVKLLLSWLDMCNRKFSTAMAISLDNIRVTDIETDWQVDFDYQHASALTLSICNGSLLAEATNMISFLNTPASTLNGEESPRPSWNSENQRTISLNSDSSHALPLDFNKRNSGSFMASPLGVNLGDQGQYSHVNGRIRATSTTSRHAPRTPEISNRGASISAHTTTGRVSGRPGNSPGRSTEPSPRLPRLSIDAPSPYFGPLRPDSPPARPGSSSTFFSASAAPSSALPTPGNRGSGVFSSAMPMADSPMSNHPFPSDDPDRHYDVLFTAASVYEFNIDRSRREAGFPYLTYVAGEIFDVIGERGELWLARNQDDPQRQVGWIWNKHFAKLAE